MNTKKAVFGLGMLTAGLGVGAVMGLLYAPNSGRQTRKMISRAAEDGADYLADRTREIRKEAEDVFERGKVLAVKLVA